jgi:PAS domain S-box-containing protein
VPSGVPTDIWLQHIYAAIAGAIIVVDPSGTVVWANDAAGDIVGVPGGALVGVRLVDQPWLIHDAGDQDLPSAERPIPRAISTGQPQRRFMMRLIRNVDKQTRWLLMDAVPLLDVQGMVQQVVVSGIEMTAQRQAEDELRTSEERFRALTEHSTDLVSIINENGVFTYVSPSFANLGVEPAALIGVSSFEAIHLDDRPQLYAALEVAREHGGLAPMVTFRRRHAVTGAWHDLETVGNNQIDNPAIRGIVLNSRDVTDRRLEREEMAQAVHDGPVWLVNDLVRLLSLGGMIDMAAVRAKVRGGGVPAHHDPLRCGILRPLALGTTRCATGPGYATRPTAAREGCTIIVDVDDAAGALAKNEGFVLHHIARQALMNAIQHSQAQQILVRLWVDGEIVALEVQDDGIGMPTDWSATVQPGHRGLRNAFDLVTSLSGASLALKIGPNGTGTVIQARVPFRREAGPAKTTPDPGAADGGVARTRDATVPIRVLIVDDQSIVRDGVRRLLEEDACITVVGEAATGPEMLRLAEEHLPNIVLLDIQMPGLNGLKAGMALRERVRPSPRLLVLSGYWDEVCVRHAREVGVEGYLLKTATGVYLRQAVHDVMTGVQVIDPEVQHIMDRQIYDARGRFAQYANGATELTAAEQEMLEWMMRGGTYSDIATATQHSLGTVNSHAQHICEKLGVRTRVEAVRKALVMGLLRLPESAEPLQEVLRHSIRAAISVYY